MISVSADIFSGDLFVTVPRRCRAIRIEDDVVGIVLVKSVVLQLLVGSALFNHSPRCPCVLSGGDGELRVIS